MTTLGPPSFPALGRVLHELADRPDLREAVERLADRRLVPEWWTDPDRTPLWSDPTVRLSTVPRNFDHLVAAAGLGLPTLLHLHEMVRGVWRWNPRILWSFRSAESLQKHHRTVSAGSFGPQSRLRSPTRKQVFSREEAAAPDPERIPWDVPRTPEPELKRAWPMLRGIAAVGVDFLDEWDVGPRGEESTRVVLGIPFPIPVSAG